jgi:hypothetical protein
MPKATITLSNGTIITIDGSLDEVDRLIKIYKSDNSTNSTAEAKKPSLKSEEKKVRTNSAKTHVDILKIINTMRECDQAENIEKYILDKSNELNRVLLPLYVMAKYHNDETGLTTSEISKVTVKLGVKVSRQNSLRALKFTGPKYIFTDAEQSRFPRYRLNRRGIQYMEKLLIGQETSV